MSPNLCGQYYGPAREGNLNDLLSAEELQAIADDVRGGALGVEVVPVEVTPVSEAEVDVFEARMGGENYA